MRKLWVRTLTWDMSLVEVPDDFELPDAADVAVTLYGGPLAALTALQHEGHWLWSHGEDVKLLEVKGVSDDDDLEQPPF
jgi:hypothetical protein